MTEYATHMQDICDRWPTASDDEVQKVKAIVKTIFADTVHVQLPDGFRLVVERKDCDIDLSFVCTGYYFNIYNAGELIYRMCYTDKCELIVATESTKDGSLGVPLPEELLTCGVQVDGAEDEAVEAEEWHSQYYGFKQDSNCRIVDVPALSTDQLLVFVATSRCFGTNLSLCAYDKEDNTVYCDAPENYDYPTVCDVSICPSDPSDVVLRFDYDGYQIHQLYPVKSEGAVRVPDVIRFCCKERLDRLIYHC